MKQMINLRFLNATPLRYLWVLIIVFQTCRVLAQDMNIYIPDAAFENYLLNNPDINTDGNNAITASEAAAVDGLLNITSLGIEDLTGLEYFYNVRSLHMSNNPVKDVQLYNMGMLRELQANYCHITEIQTPPSTFGNFSASHNRLLRVNLSGGDAHNGTMISINYNKLKQVDLSDCYSVTLLDCKENDLAYLDAKAMSGAALQSLIAIDNENLTCIQTFYPTGANTNLVDPQSFFSTEACEEKYFVMFYVNAPATIEIDGASYSTIEGAYYHMAYIQVSKPQEYNYSITADDYENYTGSLSINGLDQSEMVIMCSKELVNIPDANFKAALTANSQIDLNGDGEIQVSEAINYNRFIDVSGLDINDMTGIEAFVNIYSLTCSRNAISELDISACTQLTTLDCSENSISSLVVSNNRALTSINCSGNPIQHLDLSNNKVLASLYCSACQLNSLDLTNNTGLNLLDCSKNALTRLNLKNGKHNKPNTINAIDNNLLSCVQVDSVAYANANWTDDFDPGVSFRLNCGLADVLSGDVTITGTLQCGEELAASVSNSNNTGTLSYQWKRSGSLISGATAQQYTLVEGDIANTISVEVSSSVETGSIVSAATAAIEKADQLCPPPPALERRTHNSITLATVTRCEYRMDGGDWQASPEFTGLSENTPYSFTQRYAEDNWQKASEASNAFVVSTDIVSGEAMKARTASFCIYPNPAKETLSVYPVEQGDEIMLFDLLGNKVLQHHCTTTKTTLQLNNLESGLYFIQVNASVQQLIID